MIPLMRSCLYNVQQRDAFSSPTKSYDYIVITFSLWTNNEFWQLLEGSYNGIICELSETLTKCKNSYMILHCINPWLTLTLPDIT